MSVSMMSEKEDRPAYVRFERRAVENKKESLRQGKYVGDDVDYALVTPPYSKDCFEQRADKWLAQNRIYARGGRIPQEWVEHWEKAYNAWKNGQEAPLNGTSVRNWSAISPAQIKTLVSIGMLTIEDVANCNDEGLKRIGMGGVDIRNKAIAWLKGGQDQGAVALENAELKKKNAQLEMQVDDLSEKLRLAKMQIGQTNVVEPVEVSRETISAADLTDFEPTQPIEPPQKQPEEINEKAEYERLCAEYFNIYGEQPDKRSTVNSLKRKLGKK